MNESDILDNYTVQESSIKSNNAIDPNSTMNQSFLPDVSIRNKERYSIIEELERQRLMEFKSKDSSMVGKLNLEN
jgi:hypothetical protein